MNPTNSTNLRQSLSHLNRIANLQAIAWQYNNGSGGEADIWIDDIELYRTADHPIDDIDIDAGVDGGSFGEDAGNQI